MTSGDFYLVDFNNIKGLMNELLEYQVCIDLLLKGSQMIITQQNLRHVFHIPMDFKSKKSDKTVKQKRYDVFPYALKTSSLFT